MKKSSRATAAVIAICVVALAAEASSASGAQTTNQVRLHCGEHKFARSIKITGPPNEVHSGWNCNTAFDMLDKGKLSDNRNDFSSPGWDCGRGRGFENAFTFYCTKHRQLVEFNLA